MDHLPFSKPWIVDLLSTFDPHLPMSQTSQDALVAQVMNIQQISCQIGDIEISGKVQLHDNKHHVNAMFTKEAGQEFDEHEGEEGGSGAEFADIQNSIIALKKYRVIIPRDNKSQVLLHPIICVESFSLIHFDAFPRVNQEPLECACTERSVVAYINHLRQMDENEPTQPGSWPNEVTINSDSMPHLTQLLEEINKASEDENQPKKKSFIFEINMPRSTSDSSSSNGSDEDIRTLTKAVDAMERKMMIVNGLRKFLGDKVSIDSDIDSQTSYDAPVFRVSELPVDYVDSLQAQVMNFVESDFSVPVEVLKKLETIEEWIPGYVKPNSEPSASVSLEMPLGGGLSISPLSTPAKHVSGVPESPLSISSNKNKPAVSEKTLTRNVTETGVTETRPAVQSTGGITRDGGAPSEAGITTQESQKSTNSELMSLGSDDWSMHSVESIGLSTQEILQAECEVVVPPCPEQPMSNTAIRMEKQPQVNAQVTENSKSSTSQPATISSTPINVPAKRKRNLPSDESCPKFPRQDDHGEISEKQRLKTQRGDHCKITEKRRSKTPQNNHSEINEKQKFKPLLEFECDGNLSPIRNPRNKRTAEEVEIFHSTPFIDETQKENHEDIPADSDRTALCVEKQRQSHRKPEQNHLQRTNPIGKNHVIAKTSTTPDRQLQNKYDILEPESRSGTKSSSDLFKTEEEVDSPVFVEVAVDDEMNSLSRSDDEDGPSRSDDEDRPDSQSVEVLDEQSQEIHHQTDLNSDKNARAVHFENSANICDKSVKVQKVKKTNKADDIVEILDTSTGFEPNEFYASPTSQQTRAVKQKVVISNLKSPQLVHSISTPVNSLPPYQPPRSRSLMVSMASQSSAESSNHSFQIANYQREVDPCVEELSNITLEDEVLQWCNSYFVNLKHKRHEKSKSGKKKRKDR